MKLHIKFFSVVTIIISFCLYQAVAPQINAQVMYKTYAEQPSPGGTSQQSSNDSGNETLYIVAGVAIAAIVGYAIYKKFKKTEEDSTTSSEASLNHLLQNERNSFANQVQEVKEKIPVDLFFAVKNHNSTIPDRTYSVGLSFKF